MVIVRVGFDSLKDSSSVFKDQLLEAVLLVEESEHVLFHSFSWKLLGLALLIVLPLRVDNFTDELLSLL